MKNFPTLIVLLLVCLGVTAFAVSDKTTEDHPMPASAELLDRLTDEFLYISELAMTAEDSLHNKVQAQLAGSIAAAYQEKNRELAQLIIDRSIPAKRELSAEQNKAVISLIPTRGDELNHKFVALLQAEFESLKDLMNRQKGLIEEREIADFVEQALIIQDDFNNKIGILQ